MNVQSNQTQDYTATDIAAPTGSVVINEGADYTNTTLVILTLSASDTDNGVSQMRFSDDGATWSDWEAYNTLKAWILSPGDGTKTVYAKFKDAAENWSSAYSDTIDLITDTYTKSLLHMNGTDGSTAFTDTLQRLSNPIRRIRRSSNAARA
jgi:hypothetical protein